MIHIQRTENNLKLNWFSLVQFFVYQLSANEHVIDSSVDWLITINFIYLPSRSCNRTIAQYCSQRPLTLWHVDDFPLIFPYFWVLLYRQIVGSNHTNWRPEDVSVLHAILPHNIYSLPFVRLPPSNISLENCWRWLRG